MNPPASNISKSPWLRGFRLSCFFLTILSAIFAGLCMPAECQIKIAIVGALTGPKSPYGLSQLKGAQLAAGELNSRGGIFGQTLDLVEVDDRGDPAQAGRLAVDLVFRDRVTAIVGSVDSGVTHVIAMIAVKGHVPHLTCVATDPSITRAGSPWTFRTLSDDTAQAKALVAFLTRTQTISRIALMAGNSRYGRMGSREFARQARQAGFLIDGPLFLASNPEQNAESFRKAAASKPDAIVLWTLSKDGLAAARTLRKAGFAGLLAGGDGLATPDFFATSSPETDGTIVTMPYNATSASIANREFQNKFKAHFGEPPDSFSAHAYDTISLLALALERSDLSRQGLRDSIASLTTFTGVTGEIELDRTGNDRRPVKLARCAGGRLQPLEESR